MAGPSVSAEAHWAYASLYFQPWGRFQEAVAHMQGAVERDPLNAFWRGVLASHLTHAGLHDQAIQQAKEALEIDESNIAPSVTLAEAYAAMGRWAEAAAALENMYIACSHNTPWALACWPERWSASESSARADRTDSGTWGTRRAL